jgi:FkbH-like protein
MPEPVRLLIWDLDDTFWDGTLTEGGISYRLDHAEIVRVLARRGIVSSICSKNDLSLVRRVLQQHGIWDSFVFPSINWKPKGKRLAELVAAAQLRPETVMLIDDNAMNRAEARHFVPGIQVADAGFIGEILASDLFAGKDDPALTRLQQYKVLELRQQQAPPAGADSVDTAQFLRASNIRLSIEHDLAPHIDRAIELINRTNQLNFTKTRLPEDIDAARKELRALLGQYNVTAGIIQLRDNYGEYGYCGLYVLRTGARMHRLLHFCFSCRILNMGVETWLYRHLGRPLLGADARPPPDHGKPIDWVTLERSGPHTDTRPAAPMLDLVYARGGCDLHAMTHYFEYATRRTRRDVNIAREGASLRLDHSVFIRLGSAPLAPNAAQALRAIGYQDADFRLEIDAVRKRDRALWLLSFWADAEIPLYTHRATGVQAPLPLAAPQWMKRDMTLVDPASLANLVDGERVAALQAEFDYAGMIKMPVFKENLTLLLQRAPAKTPIFIFLGSEYLGSGLTEDDPATQGDDLIDGAADEDDSAPAPRNHGQRRGGGPPPDSGAYFAIASARAADEQAALMARADVAAGRNVESVRGSPLGGIADYTAFEAVHTMLHRRRERAAVQVFDPQDSFVPPSQPRARARMRRLNRWIREVAADFPDVTLLNVADFVHAPDDVTARDHYDRMVYFRMFEYVMKTLRNSETAAHKGGKRAIPGHEPRSPGQELHKSGV